MVNAHKEPVFQLPKEIDEALRMFVRSFIMDHIPQDSDTFVTYAANYFNAKKQTEFGVPWPCGAPFKRTLAQ
ncbi:hypothetical protein BV898_05471 [Hypsibius exemplaris]|uniref:Uncharacterized protein n=1 Tax=Hypsibius exemplaris TaxID=2072580 RepID=A0A1W0WZQ8_HYPEX|nr:hypothetical protein BV898_05471 [Hypsibius exemplaris]